MPHTVEGGDLALTLTPLHNWLANTTIYLEIQMVLSTGLHVQLCFGCSERIFCCLVQSYTDFVPLVLGVY